MTLRTAFALTATTLVALAVAPAAAQSGADILNTAVARWEARMQGVENYTVVVRVAGMETTAYYEREMVDGRLMYRARDVRVPGIELPEESASVWENPDPHAGLADWAERAHYRGTESVDGHATHVLVISDFSALPPMDPAAGEAEFDARSSTIYLDASEYIVRRMVMEGVATTGGQAQEVTIDVHLQDYRDVQGVLSPFRTVTWISGLTPPGPALDQDEIASTIAMLEAQMAMLPPEEREMMEMMVEQSRRMLAGEPMETTVEVVDLRVNEGPLKTP